MKIVQLKITIACDCGHKMIFFSSSDEYHHRVAECPYCRKLWEIKDIKIEEKVDTLTESRIELVKILFNNGWSKERIAKVLLFADSFIEKIFKEEIVKTNIV